MNTMNKENKAEKASDGEEDLDEIFLGPSFDFARWGLLLDEDYLQNASWGSITSTVESLPFSDELKLQILDLIKAKRGDQDEANPDVAS